jgi:hypothetical protein
LIRVNAGRGDPRQSDGMDTLPTAEDRSRYELQSIGRSLDDLEPADEIVPRPGGVIAPLAWVASALLALMAFVGWLLLSAPPQP